MEKRLILFRGKTLTGEWVEGYYGIKGQGTDIETHCIIQSEFNAQLSGYPFYFIDIEVNPDTVGQFTGERDRIGKHIFEGDKFRLGVDPVIYEVRFEYGCFMAFKDGKQWGLIGELINAFIEVIGNIHDTPVQP